jgi:hypothetical protein
MNEEEKNKMGIPQEKLNDNLRKETIKKASKIVNKKYEKAFKLISKN